MKKGLLLAAVLVLSCGTIFARTVYNSNGKVIYDDTIRGQKRANIQNTQASNKAKYAAAAKFNYDEALKALEKEPQMKSNYYQDKK